MICDWNALLDLFPPWIREAVGPEDKQAREIHLRVGQPIQITQAEGEWYPSPRRILPEDVQQVIDRASNFSAYAAVSLPEGYLTAKGGHRIGLCGSVVLQNGQITGLKDLRSLCIRVARDFPGLASGLERQLGSGSVLVAGPPGSGKTTLLRDLIRQISQSLQQTVSVLDQRGELFPSGFPIGDRCDILTGAGKQKGMEWLLRSMGPAWIAMDEITAASDCEAMEASAYCGVKFLASVHAQRTEDLWNRPLYRRLMHTGLFQKIILLDDTQHYTVEECSP